MFVQNHMTRAPHTLPPDATVSHAARLMDEHRVHQLPVIDSNRRLIAIVTDRDVRSACGYDAAAQANLTVDEIMTHDPKVIGPGATLEEALGILCAERFNALPVVNGGELVGILTRSDILRAFRDLLGLDHPGRRIEVALPEGMRSVVELVGGLTDEDQITAVIAARLRDDGDEPILYLRTRSMAPGQVERRLRARGAILLAPERCTAAL
jgi:acetoin utilization protein AcuB